MKLTKKHIGGLFSVGGDGSWTYQLVDVKDGWLLFYGFDCEYFKERVGEHDDWERFKPRKPWPKNWKEYGWTIAKDK